MPLLRRSSTGLVVLALSMAIALGACGTSGTSETAGTTSEASAPDAAVLLTRLANEGSDAVFDRHYSGVLDAGGEAGPLVFVGRTGDDAVVYACDGTSGTWFTGTVAGDGTGTLRSPDGTASVALAPVDDGLQTTFEGGTFGGRSTTTAALDDGVGELIRLQATDTAGGPDAAAGGVIVTPDGVRGVLTSSITDGSSNTLIFSETPTSTTTGTTARNNETPTDGNSNTIIVGETPASSTTSTSSRQTPTDGNSNTVIIGETPASTTTSTSSRQTPTDGNSNTVIIGETPTDPNTIVSKTSGGLLTVRLITVSGSTTTSTTPASSCAARVATVGELTRALAASRLRAQAQLDAIRQQRDELAAKAKRSTGDDRAALLTQVDTLDRTITKLQRQIGQLTAQIDELTKQIATCQATTGSTAK